MRKKVKGEGKGTSLRESSRGHDTHCNKGQEGGEGRVRTTQGGRNGR